MHMIQLNLFLGLLEIITHLLEVGADCSTTHEARRLIDSLVEDFEESHGVEIEEDKSESDEVEQSPLTAILNKIATKERTIPQELKEYFLVQEYFLVVENSQSENEIFFRGLPPLSEPSTPVQAKLRVEIFAILNDLLKVGLTCCSVHEAHMQLDALLEQHEHIQADIEEGYGMEKVSEMDDLDDLDDLDHLSEPTVSTLEALAIICKKGVDFSAII